MAYRRGKLEKPGIGELRHRITLQEKLKIPDGHRGHETTWTDFATVWAQVEPLSGREYFFAHSVGAEVTHRVRIRYLAGVTSEMRIVHDGRILEIESVRDFEGRHIVMELFCKE